MRLTSLIMAAGILAAIIGAASAHAADIEIAGGPIDSTIKSADVYVGTPAAGKVPRGAACQQTRRYVENIQAGRYADVVDLFDDDAVVLEPTRQNTIGRAGITAFYEGTIGKMRPEIVAVSYVGDNVDCLVTLAVRANIGGQMRYRLASVDHFTLNAKGKFSRMVAYIRPQ